MNNPRNWAHIESETDLSRTYNIGGVLRVTVTHHRDPIQMCVEVRRDSRWQIADWLNPTETYTVYGKTFGDIEDNVPWTPFNEAALVQEAINLAVYNGFLAPGTDFRAYFDINADGITERSPLSES